MDDVTPNRVGQEIVDTYRRAGLYAVDVDGEPVTLVSLPPGALGKIQERTGLRWAELMLDPLNRIDVAGWLVDAAYEKKGLPAPRLDDGAAIVAKYLEVPDDLPEMPPVSGGGDPPTTASSTAG